MLMTCRTKICFPLPRAKHDLAITESVFIRHMIRSTTNKAVFVLVKMAHFSRASPMYQLNWYFVIFFKQINGYLSKHIKVVRVMIWWNDLDIALNQEIQRIETTDYYKMYFSFLVFCGNWQYCAPVPSR